MNPEREYIDYVLAFSLTTLTASAAYFFNPSQPLTYLTLIAIPILFGYTSYISRDGFRRSSMLSFVALFFAIIDPLTAAIVIFIAVGNPLVSVFSGGEHFHDYFHAISVPLIISGLILGGFGYTVLSTQPEIKQNTINETAEFVGYGTENFLKQTDIVGDVQSSQIQLVRTTSRASIGLTAQIVQNQSFESLERNEKQQVAAAFEQARDEVPQQLASQAQQGANQNQVDMSAQISKTVRKSLNGSSLIAVIPMTAFLLYSLNPLIGFLTALAATLFGSLDQRFGIFGAY